MSDFVKVVLVQLSDETGKVAVFEVFRQDMFRELLVLQEVAISMLFRPVLHQCAIMGCTDISFTNLEHNKAITLVTPSHYALILWVLQHSAKECQSRF